MSARLRALPLVLAALLALPGAAVAKPVPPGFALGISPQTPAGDDDYGLMARAGIASLRLPLNWSSVEPHRPRAAAPRWEDFDHSVRVASRHGLRVFPFVWGSPPWVAKSPLVEPARSRRDAAAWASFLRRAVERYGPFGRFWRENPELDALPIRAWEIWNEQNIVSFSAPPSPRRHARLLRVSGRAIHRADRGAKVIMGGLFGRPLQVPPNIASDDYLDRVYRAGGVKPFFDGIGLHPYVADAAAMRPQIRRLRRVLRRHGDTATPLYLTELGWGSDSFQTRWERGMRGQARQLDRALTMLTRNRHRWRIAGAWWFTWADAGPYCQFCDSAGLLTGEREGKPSWYRFNAWTGGDAWIVPRASFGSR